MSRKFKSNPGTGRELKNGLERIFYTTAVCCVRSICLHKNHNMNVKTSTGATGAGLSALRGTISESGSWHQIIEALQGFQAKVPQRLNSWTFTPRNFAA